MPLNKEIKRKLNDLTDNEKLLVLNYLVKELDKPDPEIDKAWIKEVSRREKEMKSGKGKSLSHAEVFGKYKK
jgi:hypothetical protein